MSDFHLLNDMAIALGFALLGGLVARQLRLPPIVGYLAAGMVIGPFTPGIVADTEVLTELAEIGVVFLMFGVGMHFSLRELLAVRRVAVPGSIGQTFVATVAGVAVGTAFGLPWRESLVLGLAISVASTVVLIRAMEQYGLEHTPVGRAAIGWLIVEDLATILFLVLLPALSGAGSGWNAATDAGAAVFGALLFVVLTLGLGPRIAPWFFAMIHRTGSRELILLAVVATGLGIATGATVFGVSVALGAFVAGVLVGETESSHDAAEEVIPFRDAFAVLFFVAVGMLFDPSAIRDHLGLLSGVLLVILAVKFGAGLVLSLLLGMGIQGSLVIAAGLSQVGEFSFILLQAGFNVELVSDSTYNVVLGASVISIMLNPAIFALSLRWPSPQAALVPAPAGERW